MKTITTQYPSPGSKRFRNLLPALLVALLGVCAFPSGAQTWTVGTGTSMYGQNVTIPAPLGFYYPNARMQFIYDTASLRAAGMPVGTPTNIHQMAFDVGNLQSAIGAKNFSVALGNTTTNNVSTTNFINGVATTLYTNLSGYGPTLGWNNIPLTNISPGGFAWDGVSNILVEICYTNGTTAVGPGNAGVRYHSATSKANYASGTGITPYCGTPLGVSGTTSYRPNIRFARLTPCSGKPSAGTLSPSGTVTGLCPGTQVAIGGVGYSNNLFTKFTWLMGTTATGPWQVVGTNDDRYTTPPLISNTWFRMVITCNTSGQSDTTAATMFSFTSGFPVYASIPYFESFENWGNGCATGDKIASNNWTNFPSTGNASWRREDQGTTASWTICTNCYTTPKAQHGAHMARHNAYFTPAGNEGSMNLYVNASATTGNKDLSFYYMFKYTGAGDSINVDMSTDGGVTFASVGKLGNASGTPGVWNFVKYNIATTSPTTVIRFRGKTLLTYHDDFYIDAVRIDPPCQGAPVVGVIDSVIACPGKPFKLQLKGNAPTAGLSYDWQSRPAGGTIWSTIPNGSAESPNATITANTDFRVIVTCTYSTPPVSDTTPVLNVTLAPFYYCYCNVGQNPTYNPYSYMEIGNVTIKTEPAGVTLMNNGNPLPTVGNPNASNTGYEDFRTTVAPPTLILDSTYRLFLTQTSGYAYFNTGGYGAAWLDKNRDGTFQSSELIMSRTIPSQTNPTATNTFKIDPTQPVGLTGLRTVIQYSTPINPCGNTPYYGQYEDYLVRIEYQPCTGPVNPGTASASDTAVCPGYTVDLYNNTYEQTRTHIQRAWEVSINGGASFSYIPGSDQKDTMANVVVTAASQYRLRVICGPSGDTTYSNAVSISAPEPVRCYPVAWAAPGGFADSSDIGTVIIANRIFPSSPAGPHLLNPQANRRRTDFTLEPEIELEADSTYRLAIFHTMPRGYHGDAMVSVYMDFNNNLDYDLTSSGPFGNELVFQGVSKADSFFLDTKITIPNAVIPNVRTGMRVILNNEVNSMSPGNTGRGVFTSGEVEDFIVIFRRPGVGVNGTSLLQNLALYPNPTEGKFTVQSDAARAVSRMEVIVSTMTGQQVISRTYDNVGTHFTTDLDLSNQAKGVYFVEIRADGEKITKKLVVR